MRLRLLLADIIHMDNPPALNKPAVTAIRMIRIRRLRWSRAKLGNNSLLVCFTIYSVIPFELLGFFPVELTGRFRVVWSADFVPELQKLN
jgi:hypothetical protein